MAQDNMNFNRRRSFGNIPQYGLVKGTVAPGFVDYGQVLKKNIDIDDIIKARKLKEDEYAENIANSPADIDVAKVPDAYEAGLTDYLTELKMEYSEGAKLLRDNRVGSEAYKRGQELIRNSRSFMANLDKEYTALQSASLEDIKNAQQDMYSAGNEESNQINTGSMLLKGQLSPDKIYYQDGKIYIRGGGDDGKDIAFSDLRLRFLKDSKSMQSLTGVYSAFVDAAGKSGRRFNSAIDAARVNDVLTAANSQGIRSIAHDYNFPYFKKDEDGKLIKDKVNYAKSVQAKKIADDKFNGDINWIRDINNTELLRNELLDYFNGVFETAVNAEADAYDARQKKPTTETDPKLLRTDAYSDKATILGAEDYLQSVKNDTIKNYEKSGNTYFEGESEKSDAFRLQFGKTFANRLNASNPAAGVKKNIAFNYEEQAKSAAFNLISPEQVSTMLQATDEPEVLSKYLANDKDVNINNISASDRVDLMDKLFVVYDVDNKKEMPVSEALYQTGSNIFWSPKATKNTKNIILKVNPNLTRITNALNTTNDVLSSLAGITKMKGEKTDKFITEVNALTGSIVNELRREMFTNKLSTGIVGQKPDVILQYTDSKGLNTFRGINIFGETGFVVDSESTNRFLELDYVDEKKLKQRGMPIMEREGYSFK